MKTSDGNPGCGKGFGHKSESAVVWLTPEAYRKTLALVTGFTDEVAWHGTVSRIDEAGATGNDGFVIEDILVYPQEVTGNTVNTDQTAYTEWLYGLDDDTFDKIRMHGHSHCNMGVTPSGVDDAHRRKLLGQLEDGMFYIFMIWNKSLSVHTFVYDKSKSVPYENGDVDVRLIGDEGMDAFLADAREKVRKPGCKRSPPGKGRFGKNQAKVEKTKNQGG